MKNGSPDLVQVEIQGLGSLGGIVDARDGELVVVFNDLWIVEVL